MLAQLPAADPAPPPRARLLYIDNLRWSIILLVLSMHASDTYSPFGNWYFRDPRPLGLAGTVGFALYQGFLQAFFMALLFFVSAYFAAAAYERRGHGRFVQERLVRLGLPTLLYMLAIGPLTQYFLSRSWGSGGFAHHHLADGEWLSETGPMWFCAVLLAFALAYAAVRRRGGDAAGRPRPLSASFVPLFIAALTLATFAVRIVAPESRAILNVHPGDLPSYALMFAAGIAAWRGRWLDTVGGGVAALWSIATLSVAALLLVPLFAWGTGGAAALLDGGFNRVSLVKCVWEALVCVGMSFALLALYCRFCDAQGTLVRFLSDQAFAVYVVHPPVIIALALLLRPLALPPPLMVALLTALAAVACFALAAPLLRRVPLLARILWP